MVVRIRLRQIGRGMAVDGADVACDRKTIAPGPDASTGWSATASPLTTWLGQGHVAQRSDGADKHVDDSDAAPLGWFRAGVGCAQVRVLAASERRSRRDVVLFGRCSGVSAPFAAGFHDWGPRRKSGRSSTDNIGSNRTAMLRTTASAENVDQPVGDRGVRRFSAVHASGAVTLPFPSKQDGPSSARRGSASAGALARDRGDIYQWQTRCSSTPPIRRRPG